MAKLNSIVGFTGTLGNISVYKRWDLDEPIMRTKGGASKEKIKTSPLFVRTRELNAEFGGRAAASKWIMKALWPMKALADYNVAGPLNKLIKPVQAIDMESGRGKRHVQLSKNPQLLEGFSFNRRTAFDSILRNRIDWSISRETLSAQINIPTLVPGINFFLPEKQPAQPMYSLVATLGLVPDVFFSATGYHPSQGYRLNENVSANTDWYPVLKGSPALPLELKLNATPPDQSFSLILSIGIRFGTMQDATTVQQVKRTGNAKIFGVA